MNMFNILLQFRGNKLYDIPRIIFAWIDRGVYGLISNTYDLIVDLSYIRLFDDDVLSDFYGKVYALLAIIMLFKVTFSFISYILDPNKISDKQQGFGKIITNILVMFVMLISCPTAFELLYDAQSAILADNIIPNFIFGSTEEGASASNGANAITVVDADTCSKWSPYIDDFDFNVATDKVAYWTSKSDGDYIAMMVFRAFYRLGDPEETSSPLKKNLSGYTVQNWCLSRNKTGDDVTIKNATVGKMLDYVNHEHNSDGIGSYYLIEYNFFVATVFGVVVAFVFISIAFDIAVRSVKLSFLQLIAPIPIVSYIDPASGKNGTFSKWIKEVGKTWVSLFIRLFSVFFAIFVIQKIDSDLIENSFEGTGRSPQSFEFFIMLFIIIGALMFAKKLPELIETLVPGMKMGKMELNPLKKVEQDALGGKQIAQTVRGVGGAARGIVGGSIAGIKAGAEAGNVGKGLILGAGQGMVRGFKTPKGAFTNNLNETYKDLTGNEMARLSLSRLIAQSGSKKSMDEVKGVISNLNVKKRDLTQRLSVQEHTTAAAASTLRSNNVNLDDLDSERIRLTNLRSSQIIDRTAAQYELRKENHNLSQLQSQRATEQAFLDDAIAERQQAQEYIDNYTPSMYDADGDPIYNSTYKEAKKVLDSFEAKENSFKANISKLDADIATVQSNIERRNTEINNINNSINTTEQVIQSIDTYQTEYNETINTRKELGQVEKDIEKMKNEKAQRARFNQQNDHKSTRSDVRKIIRENK